ncbi:FAD-dependent oxidoreductase [Petropleomorpha daqingensis]|uniref:2-polyprenyl-6-methoxyphenol hydroxylase-like FAD-dependent oxidoreductase n=1 Tax=Petropleomorpha daqingensis TaxID=2026353 RepID=A0A853CCM6_9ACTN|nr:FAD-dependent oxidoreductase [Petropleomorpha daqingensis]NYJ04372.1 2-polyprenyl-6-methoxyphenol hydroxylase-like FAD-dependent oxidoreductase [Petropleomorpha daqingensis]
MSTITVLGAGMHGLTTAMLLARDGHRVTVLERDPATPPPAGRAWDHWERSGVGQFRQPHFMLPRWREELEDALPEVLDDLVAAGGMRLNPILAAPQERRGPARPGDERFTTVTARRPVLEAVLAGVAARTPGVSIRRGVAADGFLAGTPTSPGVPHVAGIRTSDGERIAADLVVDCRGRRARMQDWLCAIGARPPVEEREDAGFVYYARHFRSADGGMPPAMGPLLQHYAPFSTITLPADHGTWSVGIITSSADHPMRALRDPAVWQAALARCPLIAHWTVGPGIEPITGVDVMAGLEDRHRRLVIGGEPVVTGLVTVGDSWACTNPSLGRGASIGAMHARLLQQVLREVDLGDADKVVRRFDDATAAVVEPVFRATLAFDRHRIAELAGERTGRPYESDDPAWALAKAVAAAAATDPDGLRLYGRLALLLDPPQSVFADQSVVGRLLSRPAPRYPFPGPTRADVLDAIAA